MAERGRGGREMQRPERERKDGRRGNYRAKRQDRGRKREGTCQCEAALKGRELCWSQNTLMLLAARVLRSREQFVISVSCPDRDFRASALVDTDMDTFPTRALVDTGMDTFSPGGSSS
eukprot:2687021-Rhodomonas_salina.2